MGSRGCGRATTPTKVEIYSLVRAPPCGHVDNGKKVEKN